MKLHVPQAQFPLNNAFSPKNGGPSDCPPFFLFLFFVSEILACTKKEEKLVFYQTTQIQKMDDSKEDTQFFQEEAQTSQVSESSLHETTQAAVETIAVYLCGEVCKPGVYVLQAGSRLYQAVEEAGGLTANAQAEAVNLARILADSEQIYIPNISESIDQIENETQNVISSAAVSSALSDGLLNINQASESDLMQLPGIGQVKAAAIVTYRNSNGPFSSIEEIKNVPGIKEAAFEKIKGMITVF